MLQEQIISKSVKAKVDDLLAMESHQSHEQKIIMICAAMEALLYGAEMVWITKYRKFLLRPNRDQQAATTWLDADCR
jgi:hypothetical protein